jgi:hypothetical protein
LAFLSMMCTTLGALFTLILGCSMGALDSLNGCLKLIEI